MASSSSTLFNATKTVVIKTNNRCNLHCIHCTHCYDEFNQIKERPSLNKEMYGKIQNKLIAYSQDNQRDTAHHTNDCKHYSNLSVNQNLTVPRRQARLCVFVYQQPLSLTVHNPSDGYALPLTNVISKSSMSWLFQESGFTATSRPSHLPANGEVKISSVGRFGM